MEKYIMAIDEGTTSTRAILFNVYKLDFSLIYNLSNLLCDI